MLRHPQPGFRVCAGEGEGVVKYLLPLTTRQKSKKVDWKGKGAAADKALKVV